MIISRCLVIAAHPDDEVLGCGGTIARMAHEGTEVVVAILSTGASSRLNCSEKKIEEQYNILREAGKKSAGLLGIKEIEFFSFPDNRMDSVDLLDVVKKAEELIEKYEPDTILTHHAGDLNIDHQIIAKAVLTAARPIRGCSVKKIYSFEVPSSTEWNFGQSNTFIPNRFIEIEGYLDKKIQAMSFYETETRQYPHPRSPESLESLAKWRGASSGLLAAEAFVVIREICPL